MKIKSLAITSLSIITITILSTTVFLIDNSISDHNSIYTTNDGKFSSMVDNLDIDVQPDIYTAPFFKVSRFTKIRDDGGRACWGVATADFDLDGKTDLIVGYYDTDVFHAKISILYGEGINSFKIVNITPYIMGPIWDIDTGDFNHDGYPDIVVSRGKDAWCNDTIEIMWNIGGTFDFFNAKTTVATFIYSGMVPEYNLTGNRSDWHVPEIAVADFNLDGYPDIAIGTNCAEVFLLENKGNGSFEYRGIIYDYGCLCKGLAVGDFNRDGYPDLVICASTDNESNFTDMGHIYVKLNSGPSAYFDSHSPGILVSSLPPPKEYTLGATSTGSIAVFDYNNDGLLDIIYGGDWDIWMFIQTGNMTFKPFLVDMLRDKKLTWSDRLYEGGFAIADLNNDGRDDVIVGGHMGILRFLVNNKTFACIVEPEDRWIYLFGNKVFHLPFPGQKIVIGPLNVTVEYMPPVSKIRFYLNDKLIYVDDEPPFFWRWIRPSAGKYRILIESIDSNDISAGKDTLILWKFL